MSQAENSSALADTQTAAQAVIKDTSVGKAKKETGSELSLQSNDTVSNYEDNTSGAMSKLQDSMSDQPTGIKAVKKLQDKCTAQEDRGKLSNGADDDGLTRTDAEGSFRANSGSPSVASAAEETPGTHAESGTAAGRAVQGPTSTADDGSEGSSAKSGNSNQTASLRQSVVDTGIDQNTEAINDVCTGNSVSSEPEECVTVPLTEQLEGDGTKAAEEASHPENQKVVSATEEKQEKPETEEVNSLNISSNVEDEFHVTTWDIPDKEVSVNNGSPSAKSSTVNDAAETADGKCSLPNGELSPLTAGMSIVENHGMEAAVEEAVDDSCDNVLNGETEKADSYVKTPKSADYATKLHYHKIPDALSQHLAKNVVMNGEQVMEQMSDMRDISPTNEPATVDEMIAYSENSERLAGEASAESPSSAPASHQQSAQSQSGDVPCNGDVSQSSTGVENGDKQKASSADSVGDHHPAKHATTDNLFDKFGVRSLPDTSKDVANEQVTSSERLAEREESVAVKQESSEHAGQGQKLEETGIPRLQGKNEEGDFLVVEIPSDNEEEEIEAQKSQEEKENSEKDTDQVEKPSDTKVETDSNNVKEKLTSESKGEVAGKNGKNSGLISSLLHYRFDHTKIKDVGKKEEYKEKIKQDEKVKCPKLVHVEVDVTGFVHSIPEKAEMLTENSTDTIPEKDNQVKDKTQEDANENLRGKSSMLDDNDSMDKVSKSGPDDKNFFATANDFLSEFSKFVGSRSGESINHESPIEEKPPRKRIKSESSRRSSHSKRKRFKSTGSEKEEMRAELYELTGTSPTNRKRLRRKSRHMDVNSDTPDVSDSGESRSSKQLHHKPNKRHKREHSLSETVTSSDSQFDEDTQDLDKLYNLRPKKQTNFHYINCDCCKRFPEELDNYFPVESFVKTQSLVESLRCKICELFKVLFPELEYPPNFREHTHSVERLMDQIIAVVSDQCEEVSHEDPGFHIEVILCQSPRKCLRQLCKKSIRLIRTLLPEVVLSSSEEYSYKSVCSLLEDIILSNASSPS